MHAYRQRIERVLHDKQGFAPISCSNGTMPSGLTGELLWDLADIAHAWGGVIPEGMRFSSVRDGLSFEFRSCDLHSELAILTPILVISYLEEENHPRDGYRPLIITLECGFMLEYPPTCDAREVRRLIQRMDEWHRHLIDAKGERVRGGPDYLATHVMPVFAPQVTVFAISLPPHESIERYLHWDRPPAGMREALYFVGLCNDTGDPRYPLFVYMESDPCAEESGHVTYSVAVRVNPVLN